MKRYSKKGLWSLFLICAFPLHVWTLILAFRDFSWVSERTNSWDAVGVVSYGLILAFIESFAVFLVAIALGFLISKKWKEDRRNVLLGTLVLITSLWAMASYLYFMMQVSIPGEVINFIAGLNHPLRFLYGISFIIIVAVVVIPTYYVLQSEKVLKSLQGFFERLSLLTMFYLFFDVVGLFVVIIRNM